MVIVGMAAPYVPAVSHEGWYRGISLMVQDTTRGQVVGFMLWSAAPYALIALVQYSVRCVQNVKSFLFLSIGVAATQLFFYFHFYATFVGGLIPLLFPIIAIPVVFSVQALVQENEPEP